MPHVYKLLGQVQTAEQQLARAAQIPEMDADRLFADMGQMRFAEPVADADHGELFADSASD